MRADNQTGGMFFMKKVHVISAVIAAMLVCGTGLRAQELSATLPSGSIFSLPASGVTMVLTNNSAPKFRYIHILTNSPASALFFILPPHYPATNTAHLQPDGSTTTNTASWVTFTNALTQAAAGGTSTAGAFLTMNPGDYFSFDGSSLFGGGVIGVSITGTNRALGETGDFK